MRSQNDRGRDASARCGPSVLACTGVVELRSCSSSISRAAACSRCLVSAAAIKLEGIFPYAPYMFTLAVEHLLCGDLPMLYSVMDGVPVHV